ncbi:MULTISPECIES: hypothetical protein [Streptomyces]
METTTAEPTRPARAVNRRARRARPVGDDLAQRVAAIADQRPNAASY